MTSRARVQIRITKIGLRSVNFGISNNAQVASSGQRKLNKGTASFSYIHCTKVMDISSVKLLSAVA
ncbi:type VI secretion system tube protein Hcp [Arsenophonus endosymbiont of Aleurodicus floccissimus]|uniref:type VI secretion system tube protein Hcp n=1 Tax=Arsenophonus endosymbiont of Aleurodicus floccissimus TaxID=2152761 RepID=UPI001EE03A86|nr:type VI secretion system tube protein Hcp [Arsenophonus endosymbiont of Aleurodicus floccissimus]